MYDKKQTDHNAQAYAPHLFDPPINSTMKVGNAVRHMAHLPPLMAFIH
jgi:hypothetical protein